MNLQNHNFIKIADLKQQLCQNRNFRNQQRFRKLQ